MANPTEIAGEIFGRLRGIAKQIVEGHGGIFRELAKEHGELSVMIKRVSGTNNVNVRKEFFPRIREEQLAHAKAEEREFYPLLRNSEECRLLIEQALLDHQEVEKVLEELHVLEFSDPTWDERFKKLEGMIEAHVEMEENQIFPKAKDVLSKDELVELERRYEATRKQELEAYATLH